MQGNDLHTASALPPPKAAARSSGSQAQIPALLASKSMLGRMPQMIKVPSVQRVSQPRVILKPSLTPAPSRGISERPAPATVAGGVSAAAAPINDKPAGAKAGSQQILQPLAAAASDGSPAMRSAAEQYTAAFQMAEEQPSEAMQMRPVSPQMTPSYPTGSIVPSAGVTTPTGQVHDNTD